MCSVLRTRSVREARLGAGLVTGGWGGGQKALFRGIISKEPREDTKAEKFIVLSTRLCLNAVTAKGAWSVCRGYRVGHPGCHPPHNPGPTQIRRASAPSCTCAHSHSGPLLRGLQPHSCLSHSCAPGSQSVISNSQQGNNGG